MITIYVVFNKVSGSVYIGKTKFPMHIRQYQHEARAMSNPTSPFHKALKSYGIQSFDWMELIQIENNDDANDLEQFYISEFFDDGYNLYNLTPGGDGGDTLSNHPNKKRIIEKRSKKISESLKGKMRQVALDNNFGHWMKGKKLTDNHRANISKGIQKALQDEEKRRRISHKGQKKKPFTPEHKANLSKAMKDKPKSEEHKQKLSEALKGRKRQ